MTKIYYLNEDTLSKPMYSLVLNFLSIKVNRINKEDLFDFIEYVYTEYVNKFSLHKIDNGFFYYFKNKEKQKEISLENKKNLLDKLSNSYKFLKNYLNETPNPEYEGCFPSRPLEQSIFIILYTCLTMEEKYAYKDAELLYKIMNALKDCYEYGYLRKTSHLTRKYSKSGYDFIEKKYNSISHLLCDTRIGALTEKDYDENHQKRKNFINHVITVFPQNHKNLLEFIERKSPQGETK